MPHLSRRQLLEVAALTGAGALLPAGAAQAAFAGFRRSTFRPLVGLRFVLVTAAGRWAVDLTAVQDLPGEAVPGHEHRFALLYRVPRGLAPRQDVYTVRRSGHAPVTMLLVPAARDTRGLLAVVNNATG